MFKGAFSAFCLIENEFFLGPLDLLKYHLGLIWTIVTSTVVYWSTMLLISH